ncbi:MAG: DUF5994 family protein [Mycobacterium sp.]|jgi:hypothetical protein|nr:DUF5994 family protein [Mycobacterium sp.]
MTQTQQPRSSGGWHQAPPEQTPRLRLKPKAPATGLVDGAWWPRSTDLAVELPDLLAVLSVRLGEINDVSYRLEEWAPAPRKVSIGGHVVRLSGFHRQPADTIEVRGVLGTSVLLVLSPHADPEQAHETLMAAAAADDASTTAALLGAGRT